MNRRTVVRQSSISIAMTPENTAPEFTLDASGMARSGDIQIAVTGGPSPLFVWANATAYGLMVDTSLTGNDSTLWEVHSTVGMSSVVAYGCLPQFAEEICTPMELTPGRRYYVSVYGAYPHYGIQEFAV